MHKFDLQLSYLKDQTKTSNKLSRMIYYNIKTQLE
jgi:hypothetical protein